MGVTHRAPLRQPASGTGRAIGAQGCSTKPHMKFSGRVFSGSSFWVLGKPILNKWELGTIQVLHEGTPGLHGKPCASLNSFYQKRQTLQEWQVLEQTQVANPTPNPKQVFRSITDRACVLTARCQSVHRLEGSLHRGPVRRPGGSFLSEGTGMRLQDRPHTLLAHRQTHFCREGHLMKGQQKVSHNFYIKIILIQNPWSNENPSL